jgi:YD repeat-containing protein
MKNIALLVIFIVSSTLSASVFSAIDIPSGGGDIKLDPNIMTRLKVTDSVTPYTSELIGERIDLNNGSISFHQTDISLVGNSLLDVSLRRVFRGGDFSDMNLSDFGDWQLSIPNIHTSLQLSNGQIPGSWGRGKECSGSLEPSDIWLNGNLLYSYQYWNGDTLNIPGVVNDKLLMPSGDVLAGGSGVYQRVTKSNWRIECSDRYSTEGVKLGEGFIAHAPDGNKYTFSQLKLLAAVPFNPKQGFKYNAYMMITKVEDSHGNYVEYKYNNNNNLTLISANDGREISLEYNDANNPQHITHAKANGKVWSYIYTGSTSKRYLTKVIRPDNKFWSYDLSRFGDVKAIWTPNEACNFNNIVEVTGHITHPNGVVGEYVAKEVLQGRSNVTLTRVAPSTTPVAFQCYSNMALTSKSLTGLNGVKSTWTFSYSQNKGTFLGQTVSQSSKLNISNLPAGINSVDYKTTTVVSPDGSKIRYYYNRDWSKAFEGLLYSVEYFDTNGTDVVRTETNEYKLGYVLGHPGMRYENILPFQYQVNLLKKVIKSDYNDVYTTDYEYNKYGKEIQSISYNNINPTIKRYSKVDYLHDVNKWEINLPTKHYVSASNIFGVPSEETIYNSDLLPYQKKIMGSLVSTYTYHSDGNLKKVIFNGSNRYEQYEDYYRGKARKITLPCSTTNGCDTKNGSSVNTIVAKIAVNSDGTPQSVTDFNSNITSYQYNPIGWLTKVDYADTKWADKVISYNTVTSSDDGISGSNIASGSLRKTISQGNYEKRIYFDALLRPIFIRERDVNNASTVRYQHLDYDHTNNFTLMSFSSSVASNRIGVETEYDAIGRIISQMRSSDGRTIKYEYLAGNKVAVTDGENNTTTTSYLSFGFPSFDNPTLIEAPDNDNTEIEYNIYDQLTSIRQGNVTENRIYDAHQQLCKQIRPETGITAFGYNSQRQPIWRAEGANGSSITCDAGSIPSTQKVLLDYDNSGQLRTENFPDSTPDKTYSYDANGNLISLLSGAVNWSYLYNTQNGVEKETLSLDGKSFVLDWEYNNLGALSSLKYPSGTVVDFAPNALGQATKAGSYATGVSYHPNGQIKQFTYGNGIVRSVALDSTGRIDLLTDNKSGVLKNKLDPSYDYNDNLARLIDWVDRNNDVDNLVYDGVDRLVSADGKWGTGRYNYDGLGNVLSRSLNNSTINYSYNSLNRLNNLTGAYAYAYQYDNRGNVTNNGRYSLAYNLGQQMTAAKGISYVYDGHDRRVKQTKADGNHYTIYSQGKQLLYREAADGSETDSVYLGKVLIAEVDLGTTITPPVTPDPPPTINLKFSGETGGGTDCPKFFVCQSSIFVPIDGYLLSWTTSNADSCSGNVLRNGGVFETLSGTSSTGIDFSIGAVYEARLTCVGSGGTVSKTAIVGGTGNEY